MMKQIEMRAEHKAAVDAAEALLKHAGARELTPEESRLFENHMERAKHLGAQLQASESRNTLLTAMQNGTFIPGSEGPNWESGAASSPLRVGRVGLPEAPQATAFRHEFAAWMNRTLSAVSGQMPKMEATAPSGPVSIGTTAGWDSIGITVPTEVLPFLPSYYNLDSFSLAGATQIQTDHTRPLVKPIISAGAADSTYAENAAPTTSQPFGLSGFTFNGTKYARLVLASYEALMNSELPLQGTILDELLASLATTLTSAVTTSFVGALTAASGTLGVAIGGPSGHIYDSMIQLRYSIAPRFDLPTNVWMLSRATLAEIRSAKASTSGVPLFNADGTRIFDRPYVINDNLDSASGAGVGFVAFGSFADGVFIRKTPVVTQVFLEAYAANGQIGYRTQQWMDSHFLAELAGAAQPPTFQPVKYTNIVSET